MSQVLNGYGFLPGAYQDQPPPIEGTAGMGLKRHDYANPLLAQVSTWTWTLSDTAGDVSVTIRLPDGSTLTATGTDAGATDTTHAETTVAAINTSDAWRNVATASNVAGVVTVNFLHAGLAYEFLGFTSPGAGVLTPTVPETQAAGGLTQPVARWVTSIANPQDSSIPALALPGPGDTLVGVVVRPDGQLTNSLIATNPDRADEAFRPADMVPVGYDGPIYVRNAGSVTSVPDARVFAIVAGDGQGDSRADDDGGNTDLAPAYWVDVVPPGRTGRIYINRGLGS